MTLQMPGIPIDPTPINKRVAEALEFASSDQGRTASALQRGQENEFYAGLADERDNFEVAGAYNRFTAPAANQIVVESTEELALAMRSFGAQRHNLIPEPKILDNVYYLYERGTAMRVLGVLGLAYGITISHAVNNHFDYSPFIEGVGSSLPATKLTIAAERVAARIPEARDGELIRLMRYAGLKDVINRVRHHNSHPRNARIPVPLSFGRSD